MTLYAKAVARFSSERLINLSNPDDPTASAIDTDRLQAAADDAEAMFETVTGVDYDDDDVMHVAYAVAGVDLLLRLRAQGKSVFNDPDFKAWKESLREIAGTQGRAAFAPLGTTAYEPSSPETGRPPFDQRNWDDIRIRAPRQAQRLGDST